MHQVVLASRQWRDCSVFESSCHLPTCLPHTVEASHCPFNCWTSSREAVNTNFYCLCFDPIGNGTRFCGFSSSDCWNLIKNNKVVVIAVNFLDVSDLATSISSRKWNLIQITFFYQDGVVKSETSKLFTVKTKVLLFLIKLNTIAEQTVPQLELLPNILTCSYIGLVWFLFLIFFLFAQIDKVSTFRTNHIGPGSFWKYTNISDGGDPQSVTFQYDIVSNTNDAKSTPPSVTQQAFSAFDVYLFNIHEEAVSTERKMFNNVLIFFFYSSSFLYFPSILCDK